MGVREERGRERHWGNGERERDGGREGLGGWVETKEKREMGGGGEKKANVGVYPLDECGVFIV